MGCLGSSASGVDVWSDVGEGTLSCKLGPSCTCNCGASKLFRYMALWKLLKHQHHHYLRYYYLLYILFNAYHVLITASTQKTYSRYIRIPSLGKLAPSAELIHLFCNHLGELTKSPNSQPKASTLPIQPHPESRHSQPRQSK